MKLTVKQAASKAGKSTTTIRRWISEGKIQANKSQTGWEINSTSLDSYLATRQVGQTASQATNISDEIISQIAAKVVAEIKPYLANAGKANTPEEPAQQNGNKEIDLLRQENASLKSRIADLETEVANLKASIKELAGKLCSNQQKSTCDPVISLQEPTYTL